jgi:hypothetical protein
MIGLVRPTRPLADCSPRFQKSFCLAGDVASGMPEKLSNNKPGKKQAGTVARLLFACPFQGMNE